MDHDRLFKELLSTFFLDFLRLFVSELAGAIEDASVEPLDKEVFTDLAYETAGASSFTSGMVRLWMP